MFYKDVEKRSEPDDLEFEYSMLFFFFWGGAGICGHCLKDTFSAPCFVNVQRSSSSRNLEKVEF